MKLNWYADTETVQLNKNNIKKLNLHNYSKYVKERCTGYEEAIKELSETETFLTLNILNCAISSNNDIVSSNNISRFFKEVTQKSKIYYEKSGINSASINIYYHNLKFDLLNIIDYFKFREDKLFTDYNNNLISSSYKIYNYKIIYNGIHITFLDSYNLISRKLADFKKIFNLDKEEAKSSYNFDFSNTKEVQKMIDGGKELEEYCIQDVKCLKAGVEKFRELVQSTKITISGCAFENWLNHSEHDTLVELEPCEQIFAAMTYTGGLCVYNKEYVNKVIEKELIYLDVNSEYPASMLGKCAGFRHEMPIGNGYYFNNEEINIKERRYFYTLKVKLRAKLKNDVAFGFLRLGKQQRLGASLSRRYKQNEMIEEIDETIYINSIDLRLVYKYYNIEEIRIIEGYKYETSINMFDDYIKKWYKVKERASKENNVALKNIAKLLLNSLYGKFGQWIEDTQTELYLDKEKGIIRRKIISGENENKFKYMPIASAITSYAREILLDMITRIDKKDFYYCDTDSVIMSKEAFNKIDKNKIDKYKLGYWDVEEEIVKIKILRQKTYMFLNKENKKVVKCAGATKEIQQYFDFDNFSLDVNIKDLYQNKAKVVYGGVAIEKVPFKLRTNFLI